MNGFKIDKKIVANINISKANQSDNFQNTKQFINTHTINIIPILKQVVIKPNTNDSLSILKPFIS